MKKSKTLYVSDLDETLLRSDERLSAFTVNTVNTLVECGMIFTFATARSLKTALEVTQGLSPRLPVITYNGTFIMESGTQRILHSTGFTKAETQSILSALRAGNLSPMVRTLTHGKDRISYDPSSVTPAMQRYLDRRIGDDRLSPLSDGATYPDENVFCFTCMDDKEKLLRVQDALAENSTFRIHCMHDVYTNSDWLELQPAAATKSNAILALKKLLGCDRVICFGNGINDISMFEIADECYAVANAEEELKEIATSIIDSNDEDGVAKWLAKNYR